MSRNGLILPPEDDPDPTDRLPGLDEATIAVGKDALESTGTWSSSGAELADRVAELERALQERDAALADLTSLVRQRTFAVTRVEKELEQARSELMRARAAPGRQAEFEQRLNEVERERLTLAAQHDEQRSVIGRLEDQLSESRETEQRLERELAALRQESDRRELARQTVSELLAGSEARIVELEDRLAGATRETLSAIQQQEQARLQEQLTGLRNALSAAREEISQLSGGREALEERVQQLAGETASLRELLRERDLQAEVLLERLRSVEARRRYDADMRHAATPPQSEEPRSIALARQLEEERSARREVEARLERERLAREQAEQVLAGSEERFRLVEAELARREEGLERASVAPLQAPARRCLARLDPDQEVTYDLAPPRVSIGRTPDNDLQVRESYISRNHAVIRLGPDSAVIEDLGSRNGVYVNDRRIGREVLRDGDIVVLGKARFRFEAGRS